MIIISDAANGQYQVNTTAKGNNENLEHSETYKTAAAVKGHIVAMFKEWNEESLLALPGPNKDELDFIIVVHNRKVKLRDDTKDQHFHLKYDIQKGPKQS